METGEEPASRAPLLSVTPEFLSRVVLPAIEMADWIVFAYGPWGAGGKVTRGIAGSCFVAPWGEQGSGLMLFDLPQLWGRRGMQAPCVFN